MIAQTDIQAAISAAVRRVATVFESLPEDGTRKLIALAGPPAAGKSTLSEAISAAFPEAVFAPMDGFHLDNSILEDRGLLHRKGAPETFDAEGLLSACRRLKAGGEVIWPGFDRTRDISIACRYVIPASAKVVIVEGNYLLLDRPVWRELQSLWDASVFLTAPLDELERRLIRRWTDHGLSESDARDRAMSNDIPNARLVVRESSPADCTVGAG